MNQEARNSTQRQPKTKDRLDNRATTQTQPQTKHNDQCCGGKCELEWKPVKVTNN